MPFQAYFTCTECKKQITEEEIGWSDCDVVDGEYILIDCLCVDCEKKEED